MTPKQKNIYGIVKRFGKQDGITAMEIGIADGHPRNKSERWAKPGLKELIKMKIVRRDGDKYQAIEQSSI